MGAWKNLVNSLGPLLGGAGGAGGGGASPIGRAAGVSKILVNSPGVCGGGGCCAGATPVWKIFEKSGGGAGWAAGAGMGGGGAVPRFSMGVTADAEGCCGIAWNIWVNSPGTGFAGGGTGGASGAVARGWICEGVGCTVAA